MTEEHQRRNSKQVVRSVRSSSSNSNRPNNREVIETLVLEPPVASYDFEISLLSSSLFAGGPSLEKPSRIRVVSFQNQQELTEKLNGVMMHSYYGKERSDDTLNETPMTSADKHPNQPSPAQRPIKHCIVDLDEAFERYPPIPPSLFTSSWDSSDCGGCDANSSIISEQQCDDCSDIEVTHFSSSSWRASSLQIEVIPEPSEEQWAAGLEGGSSSKEVGGHRSNNNKNNNKSIVQLRKRHWGQRLRTPSHLLPPPMIGRQRSSE
jgi:hypothetical protein